MYKITLNGESHTFQQPASAYELAKLMCPSELPGSVAVMLDGKPYDLSQVISQDAEFDLVAANTEVGTEILRHSCAHLLAQAVKELHPEAKIAIGPVIEHGFYYDIAYARPFTEDDLLLIEQKMKSLAKQKQTVVRQELSKAKAIELFAQHGEDYKLEILADIPDDTVSVYSQGSFVDLCKGPHVPNTSILRAFKLTKLSGAYWRGDSSLPMLQRIYGIAFADKQQLKAHLDLLAAAEKRDHRKLGKQMDLFHFQEEAPGMCFWHANGWTIYREIKDYLSDLLLKHGYQEIHTPAIVDRSLWEQSGHWDKFGDEMFAITTDNREYAVKPMNCPCHVQVFKQSLKSYRDLPVRLSEFGSCYRNEFSGTLHGLMRVRNFVIDDAHIFCRRDQIQTEVANFIELLYGVYADFGFTAVVLKLATRPANRVGDDALWDQAEQALIDALTAKGLDYQLSPGEGAFYGPKIEFSLQDSLSRLWQCGTMQVDFSMPSRLQANFINEHSKKEQVVMLHRAILGSFERFIGILLEHYAGVLPLWLSPVQVVIMNIADDQRQYAENIAKECALNGIRVKTDLRNEKIGYKIREHTLKKIPYLVTVGKQEVADSNVSVRSVQGDNLGLMDIKALLEMLADRIGQKN